MSTMSFKQFLILSETDEADLDSLQLDEQVVRAYKRVGKMLRRQFRCKTGPKKGMIVSSPGKCHIPKKLKRVLLGRKTSKIKKGSRIRKASVTRRTAISKRLVRLNKDLNR